MNIPGLPNLDIPGLVPPSNMGGMMNGTMMGMQRPRTGLFGLNGLVELAGLLGLAGAGAGAAALAID